MDLATLQLLVRAHQRGSISAASRELGWLPATASAALQRVERELGGKLFTRTTRSLKATPQGELFLERARGAIALLDEGRELIQSDRQKVSGKLRISLPIDAGEQVLVPALDALLELHPELELSVQLCDQPRDLGRDDVDAAVRYGKVKDGNLIARRLVETRRVLVASPAYLEKHGTPRTPEELSGHACLVLRISSNPPDRWLLMSGKAPVEVPVHGRRSADSGTVVHRWALEGRGIALKSWFDVCENVSRGRLKLVLPELMTEVYPLTLVMTQDVKSARRMRALTEWLMERCQARAQLHPLPR
jgi:DNA-binding transcriptional LysR family regulator